MKNYFDQEFKTKFSKQIMKKEKGFQWMVDEMQNEFEYPNNDCQKFDDFYSLLSNYKEHIEYFIRVYDVDNGSLTISNEFIITLSNIAKYARKEISVSKVLKNNKFKNFSILYLLGLTASFVQKNNSIGSYDFGMFILYNWFELHKINNMSKKNNSVINSLLKKLSISEKKIICDIYSKNFNEVLKNYKFNNLKKLSKYSELFNNRGYKRNQFCTWQEAYLLTMSKLKFSASKIIPLFDNWPSYELWNKEVIDNMKKFFYNNKRALVILNIIDFGINNNELESFVEKMILDQTLKIIQNKNEIKDYDNVWFYILIKQMNKKGSNYIKKNIGKVFIALKKKRNVEIIIFLNNNSFNIDKELQTKINKYYVKKSKTIEKIESINDYEKLLKMEYIRKNVNMKIVVEIKNLFYKLIKKDNNGMQIAQIFYHTVAFLIEANNRIGSSIIEKYIFEILSIWREKYYDKMKSLMFIQSVETKIPNEELKNYNMAFKLYPYTCLKEYFSWEEKIILKKISNYSENPLLVLTRENTVFIDEFFPFFKKIDFSQKDSYDNLVVEYIDRIQKKYWEQLLNPNMNPCDYLYLLYDEQNRMLMLFISFLEEDNIKEMYNMIKASFNVYELLEFSNKIRMAHITQLIPVLELLIRELGIKKKVLPFKEKENQIHVMKDSSTILSAIIKNEYKKNNNFQNIEVYIFLYNYLYNVNSLNLRNELIHARKYIENDNERVFAFKVLIISIYWAVLELYS